MKPWFDFGINTVQSVKDLAKYCSIGFKNIYDILNSNATFSDNVKCTIVTGVSFTNSVERRIDHNLNIVPAGYLIISQSAGALIYKGSSTWTDKSIYLIASADVSADIIILGG